MAYNTKPIVKDVDGNPISQYYNPDTDSYEPVEGSHGANKVLVENTDLSLIPILEKLSQLTGTVIDEETRKSNELQRIDNEDTRQSNENIRNTNEIERIENENIRIENENTRIENENIRKANEQNRVELYNDLINKVNSGYFDGKNLEFHWRGTELGVRVEGETEYIYVDLKGETGNIDNLTRQHIETALGYTPVKSVNNVLPDETGNVELDIDTSEIENRIGNVENDLVAHQAETSPHSATSAATANRIIIRDSAGRAKVAAPNASDDIARKAEVDTVQVKFDAHKAETIQNGVHGLATTRNITYYVNPTNGNDENDGTENSPFKTIQKAIDSLPKIINHTVRIFLEDGIYNENIIISGFIGTESIRIRGRHNNRETVIINGRIIVRSNIIYVELTFFTLKNFTEFGISADINVSVAIYNLIIDGSMLSNDSMRVGIRAHFSGVQIGNCEFINFETSSVWTRGAVFSSACGVISTFTCTFRNVDIAFFASYGTIHGAGNFSYNNVNTAFATRYGGQIWGVNAQ